MGMVVVVGAGVAGLAFALAHGRAGHQVVLVERDADEPPTDPADAFEIWSRRGTPQARSLHQFLPRARRELTNSAPEVVASLLEAGAVERDLRPFLPDDPTAEDDDLRAWYVRRPVFEAVLRQAVNRLPAVELRSNATVKGVIVDHEAGSTVLRGVETSDGPISADLVVIAGGRRVPIREWLGRHGVDWDEGEATPCGITYFSRHYLLRPGVDMPVVRAPITEGGSLGYFGYGITPADNGTFAILFAIPPHDLELRRLGDPAAFDAVAQAIPSTARFVDAEVSVPIMSPAPMAGLVNRLTPQHREPARRTRRIVVVGDAWMTTDPMFGWGASLALSHGFGLARCLSDHREDPDAAIEEFVSSYSDEAVQRVDAARSDARARTAHWGRPDEQTEVEHQQQALLFALRRQARTDGRAARAVLRRTCLLDRPDTVWRNAEVVASAKHYLTMHPFDPARHEDGPTRPELLALLG
jgi:2-polyprenyl-6-methoxyphenol hydroxylase-like FAD-dependent oxidoreductase